ncbi:MAG: acyl-CoA/acyl-ACP dehydrogenase [Leptospiraceae bacterium]|nr:acyl-CoA/acyl-ACP dehydrogenase [Leptospiraceae bacterium]
MNIDLTDEQKEFADSFRNFCNKEILSYSEGFEEKGEIPKFIFQKLGDVGFNGLLHSKKFGGQDSDYTTTMIAQEILAETCGSTFFSVGASAGLFGLPISEHGNEVQKEKYLPEIIKGNTIGCLAVTEPDAGSDVSSMKTVAEKKGDSYFLNGQKTYITNAPVADYAIVLAYLKNENKGLTTFIVDLSSKGVSRGKKMKKMGLNGSPTGEIFFEDVELKESDILGRKGKGFSIIMQAFNRERLSLGAYCVGVMAACIKDSKSFAKSRKSFGRPIIKHQLVSFQLAEMLMKYEASKILLFETAFLMDKDKSQNGLKVYNGYPIDLTAKTATLKLLSSTYAREVCNSAVQIHGGAGFMEEYRVSRLYRDIKLAEIGGGTSEIQKQIIARSEAKRVKS